MADAGERHSLSFSAYGAEIRVEADRREFVEGVRTRLDALLPEGVNPLVERADSHLFTVLLAPDGTVALSLDGAPIGQHASAPIALDYLAARIKLAVGEFATSHVFVHAGVVGIGGGAVVVPASSCQGKTTLVRELVLRGAVYYSDDFALVDAAGRVSPFAKALSVRPDRGDLRQVEQAVESLGGVAGEVPLSVDAVLFTHYDPGAQWQPRRIGQSAALLRLLPHTLPIRTAPELSLAALGRMVAGASLWESPRGEVGEVADWIVASLLQDRSGPRP